LRMGMFSKLSRADLSGTILNELEQPRFLHRAVFLRSAQPPLRPSAPLVRLHV
jgi:hypothetical protein